MRRRPRIGLLPLYLELYDRTVPEVFERFAPFLADVTARLRSRDIEVLEGAVCRKEAQVREAVERFEAADADLLVTLHLAYSPSLESADVLARTPLPILLLDTTMDRAFGPGTPPDRIMFNHGIHGVQDLASVLRRRGRFFTIVAGHVLDAALMDRAAGIARAALAAKRFRTSRVLRIGESFAGMGDFAVEPAALEEAFGIHVEQAGVDRIAREAPNVSEADIDAEIEDDARRFRIEASEETHRRAVRVGLALRRVLETGEFSAFSLNFLSFDSADGPVDTVPFLEASKAMARGLGYAGEGDALTAALVGALNAAFGNTTFTEMFCPDWDGGRVFMSHMGEINPETAAGTPRLVEKPFPFTPARNPAILAASLASGPATLVNLAPHRNGGFFLIYAPVIVENDADDSPMNALVRGWLRPRFCMPDLGAGNFDAPSRGVADFLENYSTIGGTHHCALAMGVDEKAIAFLAECLAIPFMFAF